MDVLVGQLFRGLPLLHLTLGLLKDICFIDKGSLSQSMRHWWEKLKHLEQKSDQQCRKEWAGCCAQEGVPKSAISAP